MTALLLLLTLSAPPPAAEIYELDRETGAVSLLVAAAAPPFVSLRPSGYSPNGETLLLLAEKELNDPTGRLLAFDRREATLVDLCEGAEAEWTSPTALVVLTRESGGHATGGNLWAVSRDDPSRPVPLPLPQMDWFDISPDQRFVRYEHYDGDRGEVYGVLAEFDGATLQTIATEPFAAMSTIFFVRPPSADVAFSMVEVGRPRNFLSTSQDHPVLLAVRDFIRPAGGGTPEPAATSRVLLKATPKLTTASLPRSADGTGDLFFRLRRPDGRHGIGRVSQDGPGDFTTEILCPPGVSVPGYAVSRDARFVTFSATLASSTRKDGSAYPPSDLRPTN